MALDHELPEASVVPVVQRPRRLLRPEYLRHDVPRPPEHGLVIVAVSVLLHLTQALSRRLSQARLAQPLGGLVAVSVVWNGVAVAVQIQKRANALSTCVA